MTFDPALADGRHCLDVLGGQHTAGMSSNDPVPRPIRVVVASSDSRLSDVLCWTLVHDQRFDVVGRAGDSEEAAAFRVPHDLAVIDLSIRGAGVLHVVRRLHDREPARPIAVVAATGAVYLRHALAAEGAAGLLVVPDDLDRLEDRLVEIARPALIAAGRGGGGERA